MSKKKQQVLLSSEDREQYERLQARIALEEAMKKEMMQALVVSLGADKKDFIYFEPWLKGCGASFRSFIASTKAEKAEAPKKAAAKKTTTTKKAETAEKKPAAKKTTTTKKAATKKAE